MIKQIFAFKGIHSKVSKLSWIAKKSVFKNAIIFDQLILVLSSKYPQIYQHLSDHFGSYLMSMHFCAHFRKTTTAFGPAK